VRAFALSVAAIYVALAAAGCGSDSAWIADGRHFVAIDEQYVRWSEGGDKPLDVLVARPPTDGRADEAAAWKVANDDVRLG
jgi:hypothetical protein